MKTRHLLLILALVGLWAIAAQAAGPVANPYYEAAQYLKAVGETAPAMGDKAFGDPTDLKAAAAAAADYIRYMQADITEDNAGNGDPDQDLEDAGWDWATPDFVHSANTSPGNLTGVIANSVLDVYLNTGDAALRTMLDDVAAYTLANDESLPYPNGLHYAGDMMFLIRYAQLPGVADPAPYYAKAQAIWNWRLNNTGTGTATSVAEAIRDSRHSQGYDNGIIPWDVASYVQAVAMLDTVLPGNGYAADAAAMAEVLWQDSFNANPGYFQPYGVNQGFDPNWNTSIYWWYNLGVSGLIQAFSTANVHTGELAGLQTLLLDSQYADGAFSDQYGNDPAYNFRDWQTTAYCVRALARFLPATPTAQDAAYRGGVWLAWDQDASGAFVYDSGNHYPEIGAECAMAMNAAYELSAITLAAVPGGPDPISCGLTETVTFRYERSDATPGLRGYEITFGVTDPGAAVSFGLSDIADGGALAGVGTTYFSPVDNGDGTYTVSDAILGATAGLLTDGDLFTVTFHTQADGPVDVDILSYKLRDPDNTFLFADLAGGSFTVDCTAPAAVTGITAAPGHNKVDVSWTHDGTDTAVYEVYRGLWYDTAVGVSAYPEYDDLPGNTIPTRPADRAAAAASAEWVLAGTVATGTTSFTDTWADASNRGVYYYEVFAVDAADNGSLAAADGNDRATNYWLGDVTGTPPATEPDGYVNSFDINSLGAAFATSDGDAGYDNTIDVGPTDDWSGFGIPTTDSVIDFEDLMVFAMNYGQVGPAKAQDTASGLIALSWTLRGDGSYALQLVSGEGVQGVHLSADQAVTGVQPGELLQGRDIFLTNVGSRLDANLAVLGSGASVTGTGDLLVIRSGADIKPEDLTIDLRGVGNAKLEYTLDKAGDAGVPRAFALDANFPNPFNPMTTISFSLPEPQNVELAVYGLDGRRVATLVNERLDAGVHDVVWTGLDDTGRSVASGTYFYQIKAGPYSEVRKMTLIK